jgi:hypothetical protein
MPPTGATTSRRKWASSARISPRCAKELHKCEDECADKIKKLHEEMWGEKRQRVTEQISLINVILNSVDAPELKTLMKTLESVQRSLGDK